MTRRLLSLKSLKLFITSSGIEQGWFSVKSSSVLFQQRFGRGVIMVWRKKYEY